LWDGRIAATRQRPSRGDALDWAAKAELLGFQKRFLRSRAQSLDPVVWVGDDGLSPGVVHALEQALAAHELVKVRMRGQADKRAAAAELARAADATLIHLIGHTVVLYRANPDDPKIELPTRGSA
jgi:RNA-binding protein